MGITVDGHIRFRAPGDFREEDFSLKRKGKPVKGPMPLSSSLGKITSGNLLGYDESRGFYRIFLYIEDHHHHHHHHHHHDHDQHSHP